MNQNQTWEQVVAESDYRSLDDLESHPLNEKIYSTTESDAGLLESIKKFGLLEPIVCTSDGIIISGHRRIHACRKLGIVMVPVREIDDHKNILEEKLIEFNRQRIKTTQERVREIKHLQLLWGMKKGTRSDLRSSSVKFDGGSKKRQDTRSKISKALGLSTGNISKLLYIDSVDSQLLKWVDDGTCSVHQAYLEARKRKNEKGLEKIQKKRIFSKPTNGNFWEILTGNILDIELPKEKVQTIICSPPYWGLRDYKVSGQIGLESTSSEFITTLTKVFQRLREHLADDGCLFVELGDQSTQNAYTGILERFVLNMIDDGWFLRERIIADRENWGSNRMKTWVSSYSIIYFFTKSDNYKFNRDRIRRPYNDQKKIKAYVYNKRNDGKIGTPAFPNPKGKPARNIMKVRPEMWIKKLEDATGYRGSHPAVFSREMVIEPILATTDEGDLVMDCFSGSGTTGVASIQLNRRYVGVELNPDYAELSRIRLKFEEEQLLNADQNGEETG